MSILLSSNFDLITQLPLDARYSAADITERDAIDTIQRFEGLMVYVESDEVVYHLKGGITNADWAPIGTGSPGPSVSVDWEGVEITAIASTINFVGTGVESVIETAPGEVEVRIEGGADADAIVLFGACDAPLDIPATGITVADGFMDQEAMNQLIFVQGDAGPVDITADPQIGRHTLIGAMLTVVGRSATNTLTLQNGTGLVLNGTAVLGLASVIRFLWNGSAWVERRRNF